MTDRFIYEADGLRVTWTENEDGGWIPTATRILGKGEDGALRGQYSKELETAIEFSIPLLKKYRAAKAGGQAKAGKSNHPYKELILKHMKNSKDDGKTLKQFLLQWESNPLERNIALKEAGVEQYEVSDEYEDLPSKTYTFKTFENYWGECK
jgi:hypothetical protein